MGLSQSEDLLRAKKNGSLLLLGSLRGSVFDTLKSTSVSLMRDIRNCVVILMDRNKEEEPRFRNADEK
jgi:hypothetical protein